MRTIFLEKLYKKCVGEASPRPSYRKSKFSKSLNQQKFISIVCPSRGLPEYVKTKVLTTCFYLI